MSRLTLLLVVAAVSCPAEGENKGENNNATANDTRERSQQI
jgi:hypothetical protein